MTSSRTPIFRAAIGIAAALGCCWARAADPAGGPRVAHETPAFEAPSEPPVRPIAEETPAREPAAPLELADAQALALMRNPELASFSWEVRASEARALQAGKPPNPELDVRYYSLGIPRRSVGADEDRVRVMFSQTLELGNKARRRHDLARTERTLAEWDYETKRNEIATAVVQRFVAVLGAQQRVDALTRSVEFSEEMRDRVAALVDSGNMRSLSTHQIARELGLARIDLRGAERELAVARFELSATWGNDSPRFTVALGDLDQRLVIPDVDTIIGLARRGPAIARWDAELERGKAALSLAKSGRVPDLTAGAGVRWQENADDQDYLLDLGITLPLLDRKQGDIREARSDMAGAEAGRRAAEAASAARIAGLYYRLTESADVRRTIEDEILPAARAAFEAQRLGLERQADNLWELLGARRDLARDEIRLVDALEDYHVALAALEGLAGRSLTSTVPRASR